MLETLLTENVNLRQSNLQTELENKRLQHSLELESRRHRELREPDVFSDLYDWTCDIQLLSDVGREVGRSHAADEAPHERKSRRRAPLRCRGGGYSSRSSSSRSSTTRRTRC